jgi:DNA-3-methyladenine glycosylase I
MSGPPRVRSTNFAESDSRPVLGPAGNKERSVELRKPVTKPKSKVEKTEEMGEVKGKKAPSLGVPYTHSNFVSVPSILRQQDDEKTVKSNLSLDASCSSEASSDSSRSRASTGKISRRSSTLNQIRRKQCISKSEKSVTDSHILPASPDSSSPGKKKCAWVTPNTDPCYNAFHDEEWAVPVHDDKKLFELLSLSTALAELTWPAILNKRHLFRDFFHEFDPIAVSKINEKKMLTPGSPASSLLSEVKLRAVIENARQTCKIIGEFGSFDKYIWGFVNGRPIVSNMRYGRQVPIKTSKAESISKDLVRRGFRGVGPTVVYSFMQVAGLTNDHLISCFRFHECIAAAAADSPLQEGKGKNVISTAKTEPKIADDPKDLALIGANIDNLSILTE